MCGTIHFPTLHNAFILYMVAVSAASTHTDRTDHGDIEKHLKITENEQTAIGTVGLPLSLIGSD